MCIITFILIANKVANSGPMGRTRSQSVSVTEVGLRGVEETLYQLEVEEIWEVVEGNWAEVCLPFCFPTLSLFSFLLP